MSQPKPPEVYKTVCRVVYGGTSGGGMTYHAPYSLTADNYELCAVRGKDIRANTPSPDIYELMEARRKAFYGLALESAVTRAAVELDGLMWMAGIEREKQ